MVEQLQDHQVRLAMEQEVEVEQVVQVLMAHFQDQPQVVMV